MKRILITGAGGSPAANFIRSLRASNDEYHLIGTDASKYYLMRAETDEKYLVPFANDTAYIPILNQIIEETGVEFLHIQNDVEMEFISENREKLHIKTFLPSKQTVKICLDKLASYNIWAKAGIKQPETMLINDENDLKIALDKFGKIWIRDTTGAGGRGSLPVQDFKVAKAWMDFKGGWGKYTAAECLTSKSITLQSIWKDGELITAQGRRRLYWELSKISPSGITGATGTGTTVSDSELLDYAIKTIKAIDDKPHGIFSVDFTYDSDGIPNPTEINIGRFFTTHEFFTQAGLNMPEILVKLAYGEDLPPGNLINPLKNDLAWIRGMDFEPVLTSVKDIEYNVAQLNKRINELNKND